jgi:fucose permease
MQTKKNKKTYLHWKMLIVILAIIVSLIESYLVLIETIKQTTLNLFDKNLLSMLMPYIIADTSIIIVSVFAIKMLANYKRKQDHMAISKPKDKSRETAKSNSFNLISALFVVFLIKSLWISLSKIV